MNLIKITHRNPTGLATSRVQIESQSLLYVSHYLSKISPTKPAAFSYLCKILSCVQTYEVLPKISKVCLSLISLRFTSIYTQSIRSYLKQTNLNLLSKDCNFHLESVTFRRRALFAMQTPISNYDLSFNSY